MVVIWVSYRFCLFLIRKSLLALGGRHRDWLDVGFTDWLEAILALLTPLASTLGGATYFLWAMFLFEPPGVVLLVSEGCLFYPTLLEPPRRFSCYLTPS